MLKRLAKPESQNFLGIRLSRDSATVLCLGPQPRSPNILGCFSVSVEDEQEQNPQTLARLIAQGCTQRKLDFFEAAVALDCALFMQHNLHSEFSDQRQIATTIRFDAEETLATDISDVAIAFQINSTDQHGSDLTVYTAQRKILAEVIHALQANGIDPVTIEPDVNCLSRFIDHRLLSDESERNSTMFGLLARRNGYFVVPARSGGDSQKALMLRTFLIGSKQNRASLITREGLMTCALAEAGEPISRFMVFDSTGTVDQEQLGEKLGVEVDTLNLTDSVPAEMPDDFVDPVDFAIAWGAGLTHTQPAQRIDFRSDFMPYQGRKRRLEKTLKFASISVTVLLLAVGMHFQAKFWRASKDRSNLNNRFAAEFSSVMRGHKMP